MTTNECQIHCLQGMAEPMGKLDRLWQLRYRLQRVAKRRLRYAMNTLAGTSPRKQAVAATRGVAAVRIEAGDWVRVRSREEIQSTLNRWNYLRGCGFMEEMWPYCGTVQRVFKRVTRFLDERDYLVKKTRGVIILEGLFCEGTRDYGACDRGCFYFWREEWLERLEDGPAALGDTQPR
jgi:hypothetical protein